MNITIANLINKISRLSRDQWFDYVNPQTKTQVRILDIKKPEGPIYIKRRVIKKDLMMEEKDETISTKMLLRIASAMKEGLPINFDRVLGASYNTRSSLEALLAHCEEFYWCRPGRIEINSSSSEIKKGHKHLIYLPNDLHKIGVIEYKEVNQVISEIPSDSAIYEAVSFSESPQNPLELDHEVKRRHLQIQIALILIGYKIGYHSWIARNDQGFGYGDKTVAEISGVINDLNNIPLIKSFSGAKSAAMHIDCIWFNGDLSMPAVFEVEHSTGITSGLNRMLNLKNSIPSLTNTRWVIVAPDEDRDKFLREISKKQFSEMNLRFFPYSAVDELFALIHRRNINGNSVNEEFLDCYMESL